MEYKSSDYSEKDLKELFTRSGFKTILNEIDYARHKISMGKVFDILVLFPSNLEPYYLDYLSNLAFGTLMPMPPIDNTYKYMDMKFRFESPTNEIWVYSPKRIDISPAITIKL